MLTRALYLAFGWFVISFIGLLLGGTRLRLSRAWGWIASIAWLAAVVLIGDVWAYLTFGIPAEILGLSLVVFILGMVLILWLRDWNALGQVFWTMSVYVTVLFLVYSFSVTAFSPLTTLSFVFAVFFFFIEAIALSLALTHTYESLDATTRVRWRSRIQGLKTDPAYQPMVSLHVPTYNEPLEIVQQTLSNLAALDYPNYEVIVVDNNTPDEANWRSLKTIVDGMGPRFRYLHLDEWPGFKAGALNFSLAQTTPRAEIIAAIDADYQVKPEFLRDLVPAFADPQVAFVQTPQDYRDFQRHPFTEAVYYGYKYFFEISMPARNEHNAIIFAGTMGLIRKSVLQEIGGWDEWCITEDAEASLRILKRGYQSLYINKTYGTGLMPFTFDGLKKQRFRWCFGGIQILRKHWEALMPWAKWVDPDNRLTLSQRYFYLAGGLQWYSDLLNLLFAIFLIMGALFSLFDVGHVIRPLTGPLIILPAIFLVLNMWRFLWVLRHKLDLTWKMALITMYNFFSLGWAVTLASIQGLFQPKGVFLRTPKSRSQSKLWKALQVTGWETAIGLACVLAGIGAFLEQPAIQTVFLAGLLAWQGSLFLAAPVYSLLSLSVPGNALHERYPRSTVRENWAARWVVALALIVTVAGAAALLLPSPDTPPNYTRYLPHDVNPGRLVGVERVPIEERAFTPTPTGTMEATPTSGTLTVTPTPTQTVGASATLTTPGITPSGTPMVSPSPSPTLVGLTPTPPSLLTPTPVLTVTVQTPPGFPAIPNPQTLVAPITTQVAPIQTNISGLPGRLPKPPDIPAIDWPVIANRIQSVLNQVVTQVQRWVEDFFR